MLKAYSSTAMTAPVPAFDFDRSIAYFNSFSALGKVLTEKDDALAIRYVLREVERYKEAGHPQYYAMKTAYYALIGDIQALNSCCTTVRSLTSDDQLICLAVQSLVFSGQYSMAHELLSNYRINWSDPGSVNSRLIGLTRTHSYDKLQSYMSLLARCDIEVFKEASAMADVFRSARELNIPEAGVRAMLDVAGKVTREKGYTFDQKSVDIIEDSLVISISVKAPPALVARMEWDCIGEILEHYPEAPLENVSVVFFPEEID